MLFLGEYLMLRPVECIATVEASFYVELVFLNRVIHLLCADIS